MKTKLNNLILSILGLILFVSFIWYRFIRERLPKDIPFNLSIEGLLILLWICMLYLYIVYTLSTEKKLSNAFLSALISNIFKPLEALDHSIKNHPLINPYYKRLIIYLSKKLHPILHDSRIYYYTFAIFPRLVLVMALCIDVFWFHKLFYIYKVLLIGILLILNRYIIYSLNYAKEHFITQLEPLITPHRPRIAYDHEICTEVYYNGDEEAAEDDYEMGQGMCLELRDFVFYASRFYFLSNEKLEYSVFYNPQHEERYCKKHNVPIPNKFCSSLNNKLIENLMQKIDNIVQIATLIRYYQFHNEYISEIKRMKILIFSNYLICWLFILVVSIPTFSFQASILPLFIDTIEPFSDLPLTYEYTDNNILQNILSFLYEHLFKDILYEIIDKEEPFSGHDI
jgi:hypothetical protein